MDVGVEVGVSVGKGVSVGGGAVQVPVQVFEDGEQVPPVQVPPGVIGNPLQNVIGFCVHNGPT